jgi:micrococcal nuclease
LSRVEKKFLLVAFFLLLSGLDFAQTVISADQAKFHLGESATVCGVVVGARYASGSRGNPTFINLDKPYPNQIFTVLIWGSDRQKFGNPENTYSNRRICIKGKITDYKNVPEIVAYAPSQIKIQ